VELGLRFLAVLYFYKGKAVCSPKRGFLRDTQEPFNLIFRKTYLLTFLYILKEKAGKGNLKNLPCGKNLIKCQNNLIILKIILKGSK